MRLHVLPPSPRAIKVLAILRHLDLDCEIRVLDFFARDQVSDSFAALNPNRRQPVLEDGNVVLWESNAIAHYLACKKPESGLWPSDPFAQSDVLRWMFWESGHWDPACGILINEKIKKVVFKMTDDGLRTFGKADSPLPPDAAHVERGIQLFRELATVLNNHLRDRTWVIGEQLTIADFALAAILPGSRRLGYPVDEYEAITRWLGRVEALPGWREAFPTPVTPGRST